MLYIDYRKIEVKKKLIQIVQLQMKLKKIFQIDRNIENMDVRLVDYIIQEIQRKIIKLKRDLNRL